MNRIIPGYLRGRFTGIFISCLISVVLVFLIIDVVENLDKFIDRNVPFDIALKYYLNFIPYILLLCMPIATLLATVFSMGTFARNNEMVALKSLGYSLYSVMITYMSMGLLISVLAFVLSEGVAARTNRTKENIRRNYLERTGSNINTKMRNLEIQEPPDKLVTIAYFDGEKQAARGVKVEKYLKNQLLSRLDADSMIWDGNAWIIYSGYQRTFQDDREIAVPIQDRTVMNFQFSPRELLMAQVAPEEMSIFELSQFVSRIQRSGGEVHRWMTDFHLRISFPLSNLLIVLFSVPMAYNRRQRSLTVGFGLSLLICFVYFGIVKTGQTMGHNGSLDPLLGAWLGNIVVGTGGLIDLARVRK